jgi:transcriptional regulator with XRE-family HTH domain
METGNQLKAARGLVGVSQSDLAALAGVNVNTVRNMEKRAAASFVSGFDTVQKIQSALESLGVVMLSGGDTAPGLGVCLRNETSQVDR